MYSCNNNKIQPRYFWRKVLAHMNKSEEKLLLRAAFIYDFVYTNHQADRGPAIT